MRDLVVDLQWLTDCKYRRVDTQIALEWLERAISAEKELQERKGQIEITNKVVMSHKKYPRRNFI